MSQAGKELVCTRIRAIQGHSTKVNVTALERERIKLGEPDFPSIVAHATEHEKLSSIIEQGLLPGGLDKRRDENHFLPIRPEHDAQEQHWMPSKASMPGMRSGTDIIIYFDTKAILDSGVTLHQSPAGAVLTSSEVPASTTISARARENGAVKYVNPARVE